jgi:hypothetical protein
MVIDFRILNLNLLNYSCQLYSDNRRKKQGKAPTDIKPLMATKHDKILYYVLFKARVGVFYMSSLAK